MSITALNEAAGQVRAAQAAYREVRADATADGESQQAAYRALEAALVDFEAEKALRSVPAEGDTADADAIAGTQSRGRVSLSREIATSDLITEARAGRFGLHDFDRAITRDADDVFVAASGTNASNIGQIEYVADFIRAGLAQPTFWDWIVKQPVSKEKVVYRKRTSYTNNAAATADRTNNEYVNAPRSTAIFAQADANIGKIADSFRTDRDSLEDELFIGGELESLLNYSLPAKISDYAFAASQAAGVPVTSLRAVAGTGTASYVVGADENATIGAYLDSILDARVAARLAGEFPVDTVFLSPIAHAKLLKLKDADGRYRVGDPFGGGNGVSTIWRMQAIEAEQLVGTDALDGDEDQIGGLDETLVLPSRGAVKAFVRRGTEISTSENVDDDFMADAVVIKATTRLVVPVMNAAAIVKVGAVAA